MKMETIFRRLGFSVALIMVAGSVAALDIQCCGGDDVDPPFDFPDELAEPGDNGGGGGGGDDADDNAGNGPAVGFWPGGGNTSVDPALLGQCQEHGGDYIVQRFCYDADGNFVQM